jgi:hypothetical protein
MCGTRVAQKEITCGTGGNLHSGSFRGMHFPHSRIL